MCRRLLRFHCLALTASLVAQPFCTFAQETPSTSAPNLTDVPPSLQKHFSATIQAWEKFNTQDNVLSDAIEAERTRIRGRTISGNNEHWTLDSTELHYYMYPWASLPVVKPPIPLAQWGVSSDSETAPIGDEDVLALKRSQAALDDLRAKIKSRLSPGLARQFLNTLDLWKDYRDKTCQLVSSYKQRIVSPPYAAPSDRQCLMDFTSRLDKAAPPILEAIRLEQAALTADLPHINSYQAKFHYLHSYGHGSKNGEPLIQNVSITDTSAPLIVLLENYHPTEWNITIGPRVKVRQIILFGQYRQTYKITGGSPPLRAYSVEEGNHARIWEFLSKRYRSGLRDALSPIIGLDPATMQPRAQCDLSACVIDGVRTQNE